MPGRSYIIKILSFIGIGIALILSLGYGLEKIATYYNFNERKVVEMTKIKDQKYDLLMMGNSLTNQGVIPNVIDSICGVNSYNMGIGGARFLSMEMLLIDYLEKNEAPKYITYNIFINGSSSNLPKFQRPSVINEVSENALVYYRQYREQKDVSLELYNRLALFRHRQSLRYLASFILNRPRTDVIKGYTKKLNSIKSPDHYPAHDADIDTSGLNRFYKLCRKSNIKLILFEPPVTEIFNKTVTNRDEVLGQLKKTLAYDNSFIFLNDDVRYLDQNDDFASLNHMNYRGAKKFSKKLALNLKHLIN